MTTILIFILVLGLLVLVHELGHFIAAKKAGCYVEEFGIGFPPRLFSIKKGETRYAINLLPLGGYVKIKGEDGDDPDHPGSFSKRTFPQKVLIISAGVLMNIFLGYILLIPVLGIGSKAIIPQEGISPYAQVSDRSVEVVEVLEGTPAAEAGLAVGDQVVKADTEEVESAPELLNIISASNEPILLTYEREGKLSETLITPAVLEETGQKGIGIVFVQTGTVRYPWYLAPFIAVKEVFVFLWLIIKGFAMILYQLFSGQGVQADVAGPVGIAVLTGQVARQGIVQLLQFTALLSLNLAVINILPIPALDGGRLAFIVGEKAAGRKMRVGLEHWIHIIGFVSLMILIVLITVKDISTYGGVIKQAIGNFFS